MALKDQWKKIKDNWLLAVVILLLAVLLYFSATSSYTTSFAGKAMPMYEEAAEFVGGRGMGLVAYDGEDFAPDVTERKITKTASLNSEIGRGEFHDAEQKLKAIVSSTDSFLLSENAQKNGRGKDSYFSGYYSLKVDTAKYDAVISQLKELGEVTSFNENMRDVTGSYTDLEIELAAEKERLKRFRQMYDTADVISDQIQLSDRIFNQERTVKYLEDALQNIDRRIEYTTISVGLQEEMSAYSNVVFVKFSELVRNLVGSFNGLISLVFAAIPYVLTALLIWFAVRVVKKK